MSEHGIHNFPESDMENCRKICYNTRAVREPVKGTIIPGRQMISEQKEGKIYATIDH